MASEAFFNLTKIKNPILVSVPPSKRFRCFPHQCAPSIKACIIDPIKDMVKISVRKKVEPVGSPITLISSLC